MIASTNELHVTFGAGQVGARLVTQLLAAGTRVRIVKRSSAPVPAGAELALGDVRDALFCEEAARGATTVYNCLGMPYDAAVWARLWPLYTDNLIAAAGKTDARL